MKSAETRAVSVFMDGFITIGKIETALVEHEAEVRADERAKLGEALDAFADLVAAGPEVLRHDAKRQRLARVLRDAAQRARAGEQVDVRAMLGGGS